MSIIYVGSTSNHTGSSNTTTLSVAKPSGMSGGDLMIVVATMVEGTRTSADFEDLTGFTLLNSIVTTTPNKVRQSVWYKFAENGDAGNVLVSAVTGSGCKIAATMTVYKNVDPTTPVMAFAGNSITSSTTTISYASATATGSGYMIALGGGRGSSSHEPQPTTTYTVDSSARTTASSFMYTFSARGENVSSGSVAPPNMTYAGTMTQIMTHNVILKAVEDNRSPNKIRVYNGSTYSRRRLKVWSGTSWVNRATRVWDGSKWL